MEGCEPKLSWTEAGECGEQWLVLPAEAAGPHGPLGVQTAVPRDGAQPEASAF